MKGAITHHGNLLINKKEQIVNTGNNMDGPNKHYAEGNKPDTQRILTILISSARTRCISYLLLRNKFPKNLVT